MHNKDREAPEQKYEPPPRKATVLKSYVDLCEGKEPYTGAKKYEKKVGAASKAAFFRKYLDDKEPKYDLDQRKTLGAIAATEPETHDVQLVVCTELKRKGEPKYCRYHGAEVTIYDMTHTARIIEATTGKVLEEETFELDRRTEGCEGSVTGNHYRGAEYGPKLLSLLLPFQGDGVELPKLGSIHDLDAVCSGSPIPQAAAHKGDGKRPLHLVYFPTDAQTNTRVDAPEGLFPEGDPTGDPASYQLVACMTGTPEKKKASCEFMGGGTVELYDGEVEVTIVEAATAKVVEKKTFKASSSVCPTIHKFWGKVDKRMTKVEPALKDYLKKIEGS